MTARVFIPNVSAERNAEGVATVRDYTPAAQYGELVEVFPRRPLHGDGGILMREVAEKVKEFTDADYVVATGDPAVIAAVVMEAAYQNRGRVKLLRWSRLERCYAMIQLDTLEERI